MLEESTRSIIVKLEKAEKYDAVAVARRDEATVAREKARNFRISAGVDLYGIQQSIRRGEAGQTTWEKWCKQNLPGRSVSAIRRLLRLGKPDDLVPPKKSGCQANNISMAEETEEMVTTKMFFRKLRFEDRGGILEMGESNRPVLIATWRLVCF
jgi:hypothetical protein